jgi:2-dehydropantoate 2-reductase
MRILVLGAGATGGYFGGRLAQSGADVAFLVRAKRAEALARDGLVIRTPEGESRVAVRAITAEQVDGPYDVVILSCKAYDLDGAIAAVARAVGPATTVLPLLNGLAHYPALERAFGAERVLGGLCHIFGSVGPNGEIIRGTALHRLTFGERAGGTSARVEALAALCAKAAFDTVASPDVVQAAWDKLCFLAALAASTCLMRASIGAIMATDGGKAFLSAVYEECCAIAVADGHGPSAAARAEALALLTDPASPGMASMARDIEAGRPSEGEHILGDMVRRAEAAGLDVPLLRLARMHVQAYEVRRKG